MMRKGQLLSDTSFVTGHTPGSKLKLSEFLLTRVIQDYSEVGNEKEQNQFL